MTPTVSDPVDPDNPFSASIMITNTGYLPLITVSTLICTSLMKSGNVSLFAKGETPGTTAGYKHAICFTTPEAKADYLGLDDRFSFGFNEAIQMPTDLDYADIAIVVKYEIPIIHWKRGKTYPMSAHKQSNGKFYWYAKPEKAG
jgi:hypothetical protein